MNNYKELIEDLRDDYKAWGDAVARKWLGEKLAKDVMSGKKKDTTRTKGVETNG